MDQELKLNHPWLVAVWPGMGQVAISTGFYLMAKLEMHLLAEFSPRELFDIEHVEVKDGLIHTAGLPRSRFFVWIDPAKKHDLVVFIGEAQPPRGKYSFCCKLIEFAQHGQGIVPAADTELVGQIEQKRRGLGEFTGKEHFPKIAHLHHGIGFSPGVGRQRRRDIGHRLYIEQ